MDSLPTTFVLGAGFSAQQQFPLVRGLKKRVIAFLEAERHSSYRKDLESGRRSRVGQFYDGLAHVDPDDDLEFEELLIALGAHLSTAAPTDPCFRTNRALRIGVARFLWCLNGFVGRVATCYGSFASYLRNSPAPCGIVSFNWDILVERALAEVGAEWSYCLQETGVPVIKPHGSINWSSFAQQSNITSTYAGWRPISSGSTLSYDSDHPLENPDLHDINPQHRYCLYPGDPQSPSDHADLSRLWDQVQMLIARSGRVVFLGYSLPPYDSHARTALVRASRGKDIVAYDPCAGTLSRYAEVFPGAQLRNLKFRNTPYAQQAQAG